MQTAAGRDRALASAPTLCRFENRADRGWAWAVHEVLVESFIAAFARPPEEIVLDFDATDDAVHGAQEGRFFHGYYDRYCFLPLYVFCGDHLLVAWLRPADIDPARHAGAVLKLLVGRLRRAWPGGAYRGAGGFRLLPHSPTAPAAGTASAGRSRASSTAPGAPTRASW